MIVHSNRREMDDGKEGNNYKNENNDAIHVALEALFSRTRREMILHAQYVCHT